MVTHEEIGQIAQIINPILQNVLSEYDFGKYPAAPYSKFQDSFSNLNPTDDEIANAMIWKWGHWGKQNIPQHHQDLIREIQNNWAGFGITGQPHVSANTFQWWKDCMGRNTTYITVAYLTHLIHHREPSPIIDQHNFRAMNQLVRTVRPGFRSKKKPSNWQDILNLKNFMQAMCAVIEGLSFSDLDKFLMMYGRSHVPR